MEKTEVFGMPIFLDRLQALIQLDREFVVNRGLASTWRIPGPGGNHVNLLNYQSCGEELVLSADVIASAIYDVPFSPVEMPDIASLVFDSSQSPVAAGMRGISPCARQLLYRSGNVCIDISLQPKPGTDSVVLIGQLLDSASPDRGMSDVAVSLVCEGDTVACKKTNNFGEFDFGFETLHHSQLIIGIGGSKTIVVPVPDTGFEVTSGLVE